MPSDELYARALDHLPGGNTRTTLFVPPHPPYALRGSGCWLFDADGRRILDLIGNYTSLVHGHARPEIVAAATAAIKDGISFSLPTSHEIELAAELRRRMPAGERWRFTNSGTEAVMIALRAARASTTRELVVRFDGCYHGSYDGALSPGALGVPRALSDAVISLPVGDPNEVLDTLDRIGDQIACVLFDAMPNRAGLVPASEEFVTMLRHETSKRGIILIQDEVITFRIATGGVQSLYDLKPDLITLGKVIGGGFPVGAVGGAAEIMDLFDPRNPGHLVHGGTFSANPVTMRTGLAALRLLSADEIERINGLGDQLREALVTCGWNVTGRGSLLRFHVRDHTTLWWRLYEAGVLIAGNGLAAVSTAMDESVIERVLTACKTAENDVR
jgi:glutamate-1-semialdehyde 2,1-aminomutase